MKTIKINRNSWHFKLTRSFDTFSRFDSQDTCTYVKAVFKALFFSTLLAAIGIAYLAATGDMFAWLVSGLVHKFVEPDALGVVGLICNMSAVFSAATGLISEYRQKKKALQSDAETAQKEPGFFSMAYTKLKEKTCAKVEIVV